MQDVLLHDRSRSIVYRPELRAKLGSITAVLLANQIAYWFQRKGFQPFYKFKEPCDHRLYIPGDSWLEELSFGRAEFDTALRLIGQKVKASTPVKDYPEDKLVAYYTTMERITYYVFNRALYNKILDEAGGEREVEIVAAWEKKQELEAEQKDAVKLAGNGTVTLAANGTVTLAPSGSIYIDEPAKMNGSEKNQVLPQSLHPADGREIISADLFADDPEFAPAPANVMTQVPASAEKTPPPGSAPPPSPPDPLTLTKENEHLLQERVKGSRHEMPYRSLSERAFDEFRVYYPGDTCGMTAAMDILAKWCKKHKRKVDDVIPRLLPAVKEQESWRRAAKICDPHNGWYAPWKNLETWLRKGCWQDEPPKWFLDYVNKNSKTTVSLPKPEVTEEQAAEREARLQAKQDELRRQGEARRRLSRI